MFQWTSPSSSYRFRVHKSCAWRSNDAGATRGPKQTGRSQRTAPRNSRKRHTPRQLGVDRRWGLPGA
eukprot:5384163-Lingulodinium_polyedra.AAC.1